MIPRPYVLGATPAKRQTVSAGKRIGVAAGRSSARLPRQRAWPWLKLVRAALTTGKVLYLPNPTSDDTSVDPTSAERLSGFYHARLRLARSRSNRARITCVGPRNEMRPNPIEV